MLFQRGAFAQRETQGSRETLTKNCACFDAFKDVGSQHFGLEAQGIAVEVAETKAQWVNTILAVQREQRRQTGDEGEQRMRDLMVDGEE